MIRARISDGSHDRLNAELARDLSLLFNQNIFASVEYGSLASFQFTMLLRLLTVAAFLSASLALENPCKGKQTTGCVDQVTVCHVLSIKFQPWIVLNDVRIGIKSPFGYT